MSNRENVAALRAKVEETERLESLLEMENEMLADFLFRTQEKAGSVGDDAPVKKAGKQPKT